MGARDIYIRIESDDFACDALQVHRLSGREAISDLFSFEVGLVCTDPTGLDPETMAGARASVVLEREGVELRRVHGMIAEVLDAEDTEADLRTYEIRLVPRLHQLSLVEIQEIFLDRSVPDIVRTKLQNIGMAEGADFEIRLLGDYRPREFVVQYQETDLAFVRRLLEHLGIAFFFDHERGADRLVLTDHPAGFGQIGEGGPLSYHGRGAEQDIFALGARTKIIPAVYGVQDYNYRTPLADVSATHPLETGFAGGVIECASHVKDAGEARILARVRAEEREATRRVLEGRSDSPALRAGGRFTLAGHPRLDGHLLVVEVRHDATQATSTHGGPAAASRYKNAFRALPAETPYRPARTTPRPRIHGFVTGVIQPDPELGEGEVASRARLDDEGRYLVQFHFDTASPGQAAKASRPIRMAQPHAGPGYGFHFPLRPGVEVIVGFADGDPDRPVILGAVPNAVTPSPVNRATAGMHALKTATGISIDFGGID